MVILIGFLLLSYCLVLLSLLVGILKLEPAKQADAERFISVIVAVRNEEQAIPTLLQALREQRYKKFEILVVDDHSSDRTVALSSGHSVLPLRVITNPGEGKKQAITAGVAAARGEIVATTDGDCSVPPSWLATLNNTFSDDSVQMVAGPVALTGGSFFFRMQRLEHAAITGVTAGAIAIGTPVMASGANLAFRKSAFEAVAGYEGNLHVASGDDEFLMRKLLSRFPGCVRFAPDAVVTTSSAGTLREFIQQRLRWAAKWRYNGSPSALILAALVLLVQLGSLLSLAAFAMTGSLLWGLLFFFRAAIEAVAIRRFCKMLHIRFDMLAFAALVLVYPFYVLFIAVTCNFRDYSWKGRQYRA